MANVERYMVGAVENPTHKRLLFKLYSEEELQRYDPNATWEIRDKQWVPRTFQQKAEAPVEKTSEKQPITLDTIIYGKTPKIKSNKQETILKLMTGLTKEERVKLLTMAKAYSAFEESMDNARADDALNSLKSMVKTYSRLKGMFGYKTAKRLSKVFSDPNAKLAPQHFALLYNNIGSGPKDKIANLFLEGYVANKEVNHNAVNHKARGALLYLERKMKYISGKMSETRNKDETVALERVLQECLN